MILAAAATSIVIMEGTLQMSSLKVITIDLPIPNTGQFGRAS